MSASGPGARSQGVRDPVYAHARLKRAEILAPDSLEVQKALLLLGCLHERQRRPADYSLIKCYLLHAFEHPESIPRKSCSIWRASCLTISAY